MTTIPISRAVAFAAAVAPPSPQARALGVAENCLIDVELSTSVTASAVALTRLMLAKAPVQN